MTKLCSLKPEVDEDGNMVIILPNELSLALDWQVGDEIDINKGSVTGAITLVNVSQNKRKVSKKIT